jgi:predicted metal-dependent peptidase
MKRPDRTTEVLMHTLMQRRVDLILQRPFFGSLCMKLEVVVDRKHDAVGWTDGKRLGVHPERFMALSIDEQTTLIAHEVMHCVMGHPWRQGARALDDWNIACDHAVNLTLRKAGMSVPETWCCDAQFENMSAEAIYSRIQQMRPNPQPEDDSGTGEDDAGDDDGDSDEQSQAPAPGASESAADESSDDVSHGETPAAPGASDSDSGDDESAAGTSEANAGDANGGGDDGNIVPQPETAPNAQCAAARRRRGRCSTWNRHARAAARGLASGD